MRKIFVIQFFIFFFLSTSFFCDAQQPASSTSKTIIAPPAENTKDATQTASTAANQNSDEDDSLIKAKLLELAAKNPQLNIADANIKIAEYNLRKAKSAWLSSLDANGNVNEFVINNTVINGVSASSYYPLYNVGVSVPFDIFSKAKNDPRIATENINIAKATKEQNLRTIKEMVLTLYENYKEQKELLRLQQISTEDDNESYIASQKSYADGTIQLIELNKAYQNYIFAQSRLVVSQRDYNVAVVQLEQVIGVPLDEALKAALPASKPTN
jgi:outer membrane protein TolC